jgi:hypothetical protein
MRQIAGAFAELEKARLVAKLRHARERIRNERGKCEGRKTRIERAERENNPELVRALTEAVEMARRLRRASPKTGGAPIVPQDQCRTRCRRLPQRTWPAVQSQQRQVDAGGLRLQKPQRKDAEFTRARFAGENLRFVACATAILELKCH